MSCRRSASLLVIGLLSGCGGSDPAPGPVAASPPPRAGARPTPPAVPPGSSIGTGDRPADVPGSPASPVAPPPGPDDALERRAQSLEDALRKDPDDREVMRQLARVTQDLGQRSIPLGDDKRTEDLFARSAELCHKLQDADEDLDPRKNPLFAAAYYNEACVHARRKQPEAALKSLTAAVDAGLRTTQDLDNDPDIASIRDTPEFRALRERVARAAAEGATPKGAKRPDSARE